MVAMSIAGTVLWILVGLIGGLLLWVVGVGMLRSVTRPLPPPPPPGEMRRINVRYQCTVCGVELRMVLAPDEDPPPPKHCLEEMIEIAPLYE